MNVFIIGSVLILFIAAVIWKVKRAAGGGGCDCDCDSQCTGTCRCKELNQDERRNSK